MQGVLIFIGSVQSVGAVVGLTALTLALVRHTTWPAAYIFATIGFHLLTIAASWRLMQMQPWGRAASALVQLAQLKAFGWGQATVQLLAGPIIGLTWSRAAVRATVGGGGYVSVSPPPDAAMGKSPALAWSTTWYEGEPGMFTSLSLNLFALLSLAAIVFSVWLDKRRRRRYSEEAAELGKSEAPRHRLRTPAR